MDQNNPRRDPFRRLQKKARRSNGTVANSRQEKIGESYDNPISFCSSDEETQARKDFREGRETRPPKKMVWKREEIERMLETEINRRKRMAEEEETQATKDFHEGRETRPPKKMVWKGEEIERMLETEINRRKKMAKTIQTERMQNNRDDISLCSSGEETDTE